MSSEIGWNHPSNQNRNQNNSRGLKGESVSDRLALRFRVSAVESPTLRRKTRPRRFGARTGIIKLMNVETDDDRRKPSFSFGGTGWRNWAGGGGSVPERNSGIIRSPVCKPAYPPASNGLHVGFLRFKLKPDEWSHDEVSDGLSLRVDAVLRV